MICSCSESQKTVTEIKVDENELFANGLDQVELTINKKNEKGETLFSDQDYIVKVKGTRLGLLGLDKGKIKAGVSIAFHSIGEVGKTKLNVYIDKKLEKTIIINTYLDIRDLDGDGFPDIVELESTGDRRIFLEWFTQLVELQYYYQNERWSKNNHDCSGLARFAYMEALKQHDDKWKQGWKHLFDGVLPDVRRYQYPDVPVIGRKLFRTRGGAFSEADITNGTFNVFANSQKLMLYNCFFVNKDLSYAKKGDLLFFKSGRSFHLMIYLGESLGEMKKGKYSSKSVSGNRQKAFTRYLVYHTGPIEHKEGEVRKVSVDILLQHPNPKWRPVSINPNFLGVYRWNILN